MTAVVHCLRVWRHYLLGSRFVVKTDNVAISYFQSQKKRRSCRKRKQDEKAYWQEEAEKRNGIL